MTKKLDDPQLDAAQFATDHFCQALNEISGEISWLMNKKMAGNATDDDVARIKTLKTQWMVVLYEIGDIGRRLRAGDQQPRPNLN